TARRATSTDGEDQTPAPAGPQSCVPFDVLRSGTGFSRIVYDVQRRFPLAASYAATPPRNVQHGYSGFPAPDSSSDEIGTNNRCPASFGAPVTRATGCVSTRSRHTSAPVSASTA